MRQEPRAAVQHGEAASASTAAEGTLRSLTVLPPMSKQPRPTQTALSSQGPRGRRPARCGDRALDTAAWGTHLRQRRRSGCRAGRRSAGTGVRRSSSPSPPAARSETGRTCRAQPAERQGTRRGSRTPVGRRGRRAPGTRRLLRPGRPQALPVRAAARETCLHGDFSSRGPAPEVVGGGRDLRQGAAGHLP